MKHLNILLRFKINTPVYCVLFISIITLITNAVSQDFNIPCYYCHMDVIVDMKSNATVHWESDVGCEVCHGASKGHIDVEDNSIKPDRIWTEKNIHELCNECHQQALNEFKKSAHAATVIGVSDSSKINAVPVNCSTCHGYHQQKTINDIRKMCNHCHRKNIPDVCLKSANNEILTIEVVNCENCHNIHTLEIKKEGQ